MGYLIQLSQLGQKLDPSLVNRLQDIFKGKQWTMAYIGSATDKTGNYFQAVVDHFQLLGEFKCQYFDYDDCYDPEKNQAIFHQDVIYLSGGRTPYFLRSLKAHNGLEDLKTFYQKGGTIIGLSAGAIIMSHTIDVVALWNPAYDPVQEAGLGLMDHDFIPHWPEDRGALAAVKAYAKTAQKTIYLCEDGAGIIKAANNDALELYGIHEKIHKGVHETIGGSVVIHD